MYIIPIPIPLVIPMHGGGGLISLSVLFWIIFFAIWATQVLSTIVSLHAYGADKIDGFTSKKQFLWWLVPIVPYVILIVKKISSIGKNNA